MDYKVELLNTIFLGHFEHAKEFVDCLDELVDDNIGSIMAYGSYLKASKAKDKSKDEAILTLKTYAEERNAIAMFFYGLFMSHDYNDTDKIDYLYDAIEEIQLYSRKEAIHYHILGYFFHVIIADMKKAISYYVNAAKEGLFEALFILAQLYEEGSEVKKNYRKAFYWLLEGEKVGLPSSIVSLGNYYELGRVVKKDYVKAFEYYKKAADLDYPMGNFNLGVCYFRGVGVPENISLAKEYFTIAANGGVAFAMHNLGNIYRAEENEEAIEWFSKAAALDVGESMMALGSMYEDGDLVEQNFEQALSFYQEAKVLGINEADSAIKFIEDCIEYGQEEADFRFCERSALNGDKRALFYMKSYYIDKDDTGSIIFWTKKAAEFGDGDSLYELADMYYYGFYDCKDTMLGIHYYELAAKKKHAQSCYSLGRIYLSGDGAKKDTTKALYYIDLAIKYGDLKAYYIKGLIYEGELNQLDKALEVYLIGASKNQRDCLNRIGEFYQSKEDNALAYTYYEKALKKGSIEGQYNLAKCLYRGLGCEEDKDKALYHFKKAAKKGHKDAKNFLKTKVLLD